MNSCYLHNRFCYRYKVPGFIQPCCPPIVSATNQYVSSIGCTSSVIYGESRTNQGVFLLSRQQDKIKIQQSTIIGNTIQNTIKNADTIAAQIQSQLIQIGQQRYIPYQPYIPPVMPSSVIQLQMASVNVGVPMSVITMSNCKANQSITQTQISIPTPTNVIATPNYGSASVSFMTSSGATYYKVTSSPGNISAFGSSSSIVVFGLTNGIYYTFTVIAINSIDKSFPSIASNTIIVGSNPSAPTNIIAMPNSGSASVSFTPSLGATFYTVTSSPGGITTSGSSSPILVMGLTNGIYYTFTATASNSIGTSGSSLASPLVLVNPIPATPTNLAGVPSSGSAYISFTSSLYAVSYTVTSSPGGITASGLSSPILVMGLTNGISYTFTATATNASGTSGSSLASPSVLVNPIPAAPTNLVGVPSSGSAYISFTLSLYALSYTITSSPDGITVSGSSSPILVMGLTNGIYYTFTSTATNASGTSLLSLPSPSILVNPVPTTPTNIFATPNGSGSASISFTQSLIALSYTVTSSPDNIIATGTSSPIIVTGLTNGSIYSFTVTGRNASGISPSSIASPSILVAPIPAAPANLNATTGLGPGFVSVAFTPSLYALSYTATSSPDGVTVSGSSSPILFSGLTIGNSYTFTIVATNATGTSNSSNPSNVVVITNAPPPPSFINPVIDNDIAVINFGLSTGATSYTVISSPGGITASGSSSPINVYGLVSITTYTFSISASNISGSSNSIYSDLIQFGFLTN